MPAHHKDDRALVARIAADVRWGLCDDRVAATAPARAGLRAKFERLADPAGQLPPEELARRVDNLMRAHMSKMSLKAAQARRASSRAALELAVLDADASAA